MESLETDIKKIISSIARCRISRIKLKSRVREDLGIDSFSALEILVAIEKKFDIESLESQLVSLVTFEDVVNFVRQKKQLNLAIT